MDLISDRGRRITVDELNTSKLLAHAAQQAKARKYDDILIVDCDAHHYENENFAQILPYMENDVLRQITLSGQSKSRHAITPGSIGYQDMGGRVTRYPMRSSEKTEPDRLRDVQLGERWMDAMGVDYSCMFPTGMLNIGLHPQKEMEADLCWAYNRWLTERVLPESGGRMYSMLSLPFGDPDAALRHVETFGDRKGVTGFMVTTVRANMAVHDNAYMKVYRAIEERGLGLAFHSGPNWGEAVFRSCNRFIAVHALGFTFYNILHLTNWVVNGMGERFPKLPVIWVESGLAWVPFLMQRLDHEYMLRPSECPLLKKKPSDYMRDMYYSSQPMEIQDMEAIECTFRMMNAETQLLYASDYPHWDFDLPSTISDLPFLSEKAKHNILGGTAARLFKLQPRNEAQKANLIKYGNYTAA
ncbi:MAG TPA: amidohydrolase family protein [Beijerinckiaceae bacterium]|nr:amidohydrolase family protein [Beijerinckiaceae bacterium]